MQDTPEQSTDTSSRKGGWQPDGSYLLDDSVLLETPYKMKDFYPDDPEVQNQKPDADPNS